jgi:sodium transport system ATP-binding protein
MSCSAPARRPLVEVDRLTVVYRGRRGRRIEAVRDLTFTCTEGEIFGLLGRNGAGKTSTLRVLATIVPPTKGSVRVHGHDVVTDGERVRHAIGFQTGDTRLYERLTAREALLYFARLQGIDDATIERQIARLASRFDLEPLLDRRVGSLSSGQLQRVSLARALLHDPPVLILDEPTARLDILAARETLALISSLRDEGRLVILSTHVLGEAERVCDRIAILERGRLLACDRVADLAAPGDGDLESAFVALVAAAVEASS